MLKALVIISNERSRDMGDILSIARAEAQKKEHTRENITVRSITFIPECGVYVALYETPGVQRLPGARDRRKR